MLSVVTIFSAWAGLELSERESVISNLFWSIFILILVSFLFVGSAAGYVVNGRGFQGALNHPQFFGVTASYVGIWSILRMLQSPRFAWQSAAIALVCLAAIVLSQARTAGLSLLISLLCTVLVQSYLMGDKASTAFPGLKSRTTILLGLFLGSLIMLSLPFLVDVFSTFLKKGRNLSSTVDLYSNSRAVLWDPMIENIQNHPLVGIGFGLSSEPSLMQVTRLGFMDIPISAPVEKGIAWIAIIEELGIFVGSAVFIWLAFICIRALAGGVLNTAIFVLIICLNLGEATFFSAGGMGALAMILLGYAVTKEGNAYRKV
ncbi:MAG: O-antigen ligase family protein [Hyphomicrobiales bacterium]